MIYFYLFLKNISNLFLCYPNSLEVVHYYQTKVFQTVYEQKVIPLMPLNLLLEVPVTVTLHEIIISVVFQLVLSFILMD